MKAKKRNIRSGKLTLREKDKRAGSVTEKENTGKKQLHNKIFAMKKCCKKGHGLMDFISHMDITDEITRISERNSNGEYGNYHGMGIL
jgi:hypothetical protein